MRNLLLSCIRRLPAHICALPVIFVAMLLLTGTAAAQVEPLETESVAGEEKHDIRIGFYLSAVGFLRQYTGKTTFNICCDNEYHDDPPYPFVQMSIRYNSYQGVFFRSDDENEVIYNFTGRYNYFPNKNNNYFFGGISVIYFNRKKTLDLVPIVDRPDGVTIIPGILGGYGMERKVIGINVSFEIEMLITPCSYKEYLCGVALIDPKIGVHIDI